MSFSKRKSPTYWIPSKAAGFVIYADRNAIGFHFEDNEGEQVFVSLPGELVFGLIENAERVLAEYPEAKSYKTVHPPQPKPH
jgi:hypothetical protein